jgi:hypothetical protein
MADVVGYTRLLRLQEVHAFRYGITHFYESGQIFLVGFGRLPSTTAALGEGIRSQEEENQSDLDQISKQRESLVRGLAEARQRHSGIPRPRDRYFRASNRELVTANVVPSEGPFRHLRYWSSLTISLQSTAFPSTCS